MKVQSNILGADVQSPSELLTVIGIVTGCPTQNPIVTYDPDAKKFVIFLYYANSGDADWFTLDVWGGDGKPLYVGILYTPIFDIKSKSSNANVDEDVITYKLWKIEFPFTPDDPKLQQDVVSYIGPRDNSDKERRKTVSIIQHAGDGDPDGIRHSQPTTGG